MLYKSQPLLTNHNSELQNPRHLPALLVSLVLLSRLSLRVSPIKDMNMSSAYQTGRQVSPQTHVIDT